MEKIIELFEKDKFAKNCGIEIIEVRLGFAKCQMKVTENHLNGIGILMGGAIFTLGDFAFSVAANSHGNIAVSLNAFISYLKPCTAGEVTAIATEVSRTKKTGIYRVSITDDEGEAIAELTGTAFFK
jgi:acyl-CoA thioesterase